MPVRLPYRRALLLSLPGLALSAPAPGTIVYPVFGGLQDGFGRFCSELLKLAVERSGTNYRTEAIVHPVGQGRAIRELALGRPDFNMIRSMTSVDREQMLLPIRVPVDRGLMGWRLLLVRREDQAAFARMHSLDELKVLTAGQMYDWPDTTILRANGLQVGTASQYLKLFSMLARGRIDYFPRSVLEIEEELANYGGGELAIAPGLMLRYPTAFYFFVSPHEPRLAEDLRRGMDRAVSDGSLQALFQQLVMPHLKRLNLAERRVLQLKNPLLPAATPLQRAELWEEPGGRGL